MSFKRELFEMASNSIIRGLRLNRASKVVCELTQKISPVFTARANGREYRFHCPNDLTRWRAATLFTKEPETIEWIDTFREGDVFFDIGANVGLYSIYASSRGIRTLSFEPESQNYALLNRNVFLNRLADRMHCLNLALSDREGIDYLYMPDFQPGGALNNLGEARDYKHEQFEPKFRQAVMSCSLDGFLAKNPEIFPNHIKIDVDGIEPRIIRGAEQTLRDHRVRSLLIELNEALPEDLETARTIETFGLRFLHKKHSAMASGGAFSTIINYVFVRP